MRSVLMPLPTKEEKKKEETFSMFRKRMTNETTEVQKKNGKFND